MPPHESLGAIDQSRRLAGEHQREKPDSFTESHAGEGAADTHQGGPENDAGEVLVPEKNQAQSRDERQRYTRDLSGPDLHRSASWLALQGGPGAWPKQVRCPALVSE